MNTLLEHSGHGAAGVACAQAAELDRDHAMNAEPLQKFQRTLKFPSIEQRVPQHLMELSLAQLQRLADHFDLGRVVRMDTPLTTQCNTTDPFKTGQGTFMLRARHDEEFGERVEYMHDLIGFLRKNHFPTAEVMRSPRDGKTWTKWGERVVEIHRFVPHDPGIHRDWRRMNAAATALGDLHRLLAQATTGRTPVPPEMRNDIMPDQCWNLLDEAEATVANYSAGYDPQVERGVDICRRARMALETMTRDYSRVIGSLPWMTVHGDFHFWNVLYRADQIAAVVDFDFIQERERIFDIAYALQNVVTHLHTSHGGTLRDWGDLAWHNVRIWVDLYDEATHLPLSKAERQSLPREILRIFLVGIATSVLQENPLVQIIRQGAELDLFLWVGQNKNLFL